MKNVLQPLTALLALPLLNDADARVAVMPTAVPSGAFGVLFAVRYNVASAADRDHAHRKHAAQHRDAHGRDPAGAPTQRDALRSLHDDRLWSAPTPRP